MHIVNIHEAKTTLSHLLAQVAMGEEVIIAKAGKPMAKLVPFAEDLTPRKLGGAWEGKVWIADDFDEIPEEFLPYIEGGEEEEKI
jgi:prevent-host-death family protein